MRAALAAWLLLANVAFAQGSAQVPELPLEGEYPVEGMRGGNLSGLALCAGELWAVSDRDDDQVYRMDRTGGVWQSRALTFEAPPAPDVGLPWSLVARAAAAGLVRGGSLDFEGIACDAQQRIYLVSEAKASVLRISPSGAQWLPLPMRLVAEARENGLLHHFNALFEGLAIDPEAQRLWLAAEREQRGLLAVQRRADSWDCNGPCVLLSEGGSEEVPVPMRIGLSYAKDFSDLTYFKGKLFTLERNAYKVCRRDPTTAAVERCWSFAEAGLQPSRRYDKPYGLTEALALDDTGAWIGTDNNDWARADGERRPVVWRFAAPPGGWEAAP
ncbi:esterase-like activity of phytase family protein [Pseudomonas entomophila]|uniref:esterase-like activity of phytase family protein n=1 Tax=Pseudomonas sp. RIT-PI-S TaxID=3035295 RepID=UPI0021D8728D